MIWVLSIALGIVVALFAGFYVRSQKMMDQLTADQQRALLTAEKEADDRITRAKRTGETEKNDGKTRVLKDLLPSLDALDAAVRAFDDPSMPLVQKSFRDAFKKHGVTPIIAEPGDPFDPEVHEAIGTESASGYPHRSVVRCQRLGYRIENRVVRAAMVVVSDGIDSENE